MMTVRQRILDLLSTESMTVNDLAARLGIPIKDVNHHLNHAHKSVRPPKKFIVEPAECQECGFVFKDRRKLNVPSKCPKCKSNRILEQLFRIEGG